MAHLLIVVLLLLLALYGLMALLRHVRYDQAATIIEHWRRNGLS